MNHSHSQNFSFNCSWMCHRLPVCLSFLFPHSVLSLCVSVCLSRHIDLNNIPTDHGHVDTAVTLDFTRCAAHKGALCPDQAWTGHAVRGSRRQPDQTSLWHQGIFSQEHCNCSIIYPSFNKVFMMQVWTCMYLYQSFNHFQPSFLLKLCFASE